MHQPRKIFSDEEIIAVLCEFGWHLGQTAAHYKVSARSVSYWVAEPKFKKAKQEWSLKQMGMTQRAAESTILDGLEVSGISRYVTLEDGSRAWVKTNKDKTMAAEAMQALREAACADLPKVEEIAPPQKINGKMATVIPIGDAHVGMMAWHEESGDDFDLDIAVRDLCGAFKYLIDQGPPTEKCIIANVGDFWHYHAMEAKTERSGHILSASGRPQQMIRAGVKALRFCIEYAATKHQIVESINVAGNHDSLLAHALNIMLDNIYENNDRIKIHTSPAMRHYTRHGKCFFGVTHGHLTKDKDLAVIMATERAQDWGETSHRVWFRGHHHHDSRVEYNGAVVEQIRTLAASDDYAAGGGYLSGRDLKAVLYHSEYGEVGRNVCGIDLLREVLR